MEYSACESEVCAREYNVLGSTAIVGCCVNGHRWRSGGMGSVIRGERGYGWNTTVPIRSGRIALLAHPCAAHFHRLEAPPPWRHADAALLAGTLCHRRSHQRGERRASGCEPSRPGCAGISCWGCPALACLAEGETEQANFVTGSTLSPPVASHMARGSFNPALAPGFSN